MYNWKPFLLVVSLPRMFFVFIKTFLIIASSIKDILRSANNIDPKLSSFLKIEKIDLVWGGIQTSSPAQKHFIKQFHRWFDALKTLKLLKTFSNQSQ